SLIHNPGLWGTLGLLGAAAALAVCVGLGEAAERDRSGRVLIVGASVIGAAAILMLIGVGTAPDPWRSLGILGLGSWALQFSVTRGIRRR
ncbi:MAG TPA: hypothetical protein VFU47_13080, partial [Armatimonadota bacterium]|nr:hypothetical protein [Armatimonadota bacterium]